CATMRAIVSVTPPAGTGTMSFTLPLGKLCAVPGTTSAVAPIRSAMAAAHAVRERFGIGDLLACVSTICRRAGRAGGGDHRVADAERLGVDESEGNTRALVTAVGPGVVGAALDHDVALLELDRGVVHVHLDLAFHHDDVVDGFGAVHVRGIAGRKVDHGKTRSLGRRRRAGDAPTHVLDRLADRDFCRGAVGAPHHGGDESRLRELGVGRRRIEQDFGHAMGIVARHHAPNRRVLWVLHSICPRTWFADARLASAWQSRHPRPELYLEHRQRLSLARWYLCTMFFSLAWPMHT